ncbi:MAG: preprotein translocase subunit SecG [Spirochaetaceae bacterium]|jgi:preprotein translocase subunit SecG|nr:preprotein translocase subunit SecG [Spirochaetaceae bacterium]
MNVLSIFLLVLFIIVSVLLILLVLVQNEEGDSLGGVFAGGSSSAFGARSGNILSKTSSVLGALFFILSFSLAMLNRTPADDRSVEEAGRRLIPQTEQNTDLKVFEPKDAAADRGPEEPAAVDSSFSEVPDVPVSVPPANGAEPVVSE